MQPGPSEGPACRGPKDIDTDRPEGFWRQEVGGGTSVPLASSRAPGPLPNLTAPGRVQDTPCPESQHWFLEGHLVSLIKTYRKKDGLGLVHKFSDWEKDAGSPAVMTQPLFRGLRALWCVSPAVHKVPKGQGTPSVMANTPLQSGVARKSTKKSWASAKTGLPPSSPLTFHSREEQDCSLQRVSHSVVQGQELHLSGGGPSPPSPSQPSVWGWAAPRTGSSSPPQVP